MKHTTAGMNTKKALSASLKKLMGRKRLSKITVSEIIADCGVNRKTFYYHFEDIYALLKWTLEQETVEVLKNFDLLINSEEALLFVLDYVDNNLHLLNCAYDSMGRDEMKRFFHADFYDILLHTVERLEAEQGITVPEDFKRYLAAFYTEALAGMLIDYFQHKDKRNRDELVRYTLLILQNSLPNALAAEAQKQ